MDWKGAFWSYADATGDNLDLQGRLDKNKGQIEGKPIHPAAKFITRLYKNDMIELKEGDDIQIMRVGGFSTTNNRIDLRPQFETESKQQYLSINVLKNCFGRKIRLHEDGHYKD